MEELAVDDDVIVMNDVRVRVAIEDRVQVPDFVADFVALGDPDELPV